MASTPDLASCISSNSNGDVSPVNPFYALRYQFGMLLGVDDFETEQAYHRGKSRLHNAWLHREGVVWGLDVKLDATHNEIRVTSGLALDAAGHELHLDAEACVNLPAWYEAHKNDTGFVATPTGNGVTFDAHVVIAFDGCLTRQVPAMLEPCQNSKTDTAYSRIFETVKLSLLPGSLDVVAKPYHRLRLLFDLDNPIMEGGSPTVDDQAVLDDRQAILALALQDQPPAYLIAFRKYAALDEIDLRPEIAADSSLLLFPAGDETTVLLADLHDIALTDNNGTWTLTGGTVDRSVRPAHVATATIQELLCGPLFRDNPEGSATKGPQVVPDSLTNNVIGGITITFECDSDIQAGTVQTQAFSATSLDPTGGSGWVDLGLNSVALGADQKTITLTLVSGPASGSLLRVIAKGTGPTPLLGTNLIPLGGNASSSDGQDFVYMKEV